MRHPHLTSKSEHRNPNIGGLGARRIRRWTFDVRSSIFCLIVFLGGGFGDCLSANESSAPQSAPTTPAATHPFTETDLLALLTTTLQQDYVKDKGELELSLRQPWESPAVPAEPVTLKLMELPASGVSPSFIVRFQICTSTSTLGTWQVAIQAHVWREIWVAHTSLRRGTPVSEADVARDRRDVLNVREALAEFPAGDPNLELAEPVPSSAPLLARMIKARTVIRRGQIANAIIEDGTLNVSTKVQALEDGAPGQTIRARNPVSQRDLSGRVVDGQTILISL